MMADNKEQRVCMKFCFLLGTVRNLTAAMPFPLIWGKGEVCTGFLWGNLRERDRWGDPGVNGRIMLGWFFKKWDVDVRTGLGWLRIGIGGGRF
jgi:hypothetical protein